MTDKILILIIILFILIGLFLVYNYFVVPRVEGLKMKILDIFQEQNNLSSTEGDFQGPNGVPSIGGPSELPPTGQPENGTSTVKKVDDFRGPSEDPPSVKGPTGPPPSKE